MRAALSGLGRGGLIAVIAALALALAMVMWVFTVTPSAQAQASEKIAVCHAVPVAANKPTKKYVYLEVDNNATLEGHANHPKDVILGPASEHTAADCPTPTSTATSTST